MPVDYPPAPSSVVDPAVPNSKVRMEVRMERVGECTVEGFREGASGGGVGAEGMLVEDDRRSLGTRLRKQQQGRKNSGLYVNVTGLSNATAPFGVSASVPSYMPSPRNVITTMGRTIRPDTRTVVRPLPPRNAGTMSVSPSLERGNTMLMRRRDATTSLPQPRPNSHETIVPPGKAPISEKARETEAVPSVTEKARIVGGKYEMIRTLGRGCFGSVFLSRCLGSKNQVAIKTAERKNVREVEALRREWQILNVLDHRNVIKALDYFEDFAACYLVLELCDGSMIDYLCKNPSVSWERKFQMFEELVEAVTYLHSSGICHRDIKPANLLISGDGHVKVADFGVAGLFKERELLPLAGDASCMPPEVFSGKGVIDVKTDAWSIGLILYGLIYNSCPYAIPRVHPSQQNEIAEHIMRAEFNFAPGPEEIFVSILGGLLEKEPYLRLDVSAVKMLLSLHSDAKVVQSAQQQDITRLERELASVNDHLKGSIVEVTNLRAAIAHVGQEVGKKEQECEGLESELAILGGEMKSVEQARRGFKKVVKGRKVEIAEMKKEIAFLRNNASEGTSLSRSKAMPALVHHHHPQTQMHQSKSAQPRRASAIPAFSSSAPTSPTEHPVTYNTDKIHTAHHPPPPSAAPAACPTSTSTSDQQQQEKPEEGNKGETKIAASEVVPPPTNTCDHPIISEPAPSITSINSESDRHPPVSEPTQPLAASQRPMDVVEARLTEYEGKEIFNDKAAAGGGGEEGTKLLAVESEEFKLHTHLLSKTTEELRFGLVCIRQDNGKFAGQIAHQVELVSTAQQTEVTSAHNEAQTELDLNQLLEDAKEATKSFHAIKSAQSIMRQQMEQNQTEYAKEKAQLKKRMQIQKKKSRNIEKTQAEVRKRLLKALKRGERKRRYAEERGKMSLLERWCEAFTAGANSDLPAPSPARIDTVPSVPSSAAKPPPQATSGPDAARAKTGTTSGGLLRCLSGCVETVVRRVGRVGVCAWVVGRVGIGGV
ncbi:hypothetical protein HDV00_002755 [Rhizophlyctis rosea]|nr:hypothetical protein HDV00_002755 [Rhizophlyctis rosea]